MKKTFTRKNANNWVHQVEGKGERNQTHLRKRIEVVCDKCKPFFLQYNTTKFEQRRIITDDQLRPAVFCCTPVLHHPSTLWVRFHICFESEPTLGTPTWYFQKIQTPFPFKILLHNVVLQQWRWDKEIMFILMRLRRKMITTTLKMILYTTRISLVLIC